MNWTESIDAYCERTGPEVWAEPINAATNAAFLVAAAVVLALRPRGDRTILAFALLIGIIGIGSALFHTLATRWASLADVLPIAVFIFGYFFVALRRFLGLGAVAAGGATLAFLAASAVVPRLAAPVMGSSAGYLPALLALAGMGLAALPRNPAAGRRLLAGAGLFALSLGARMADEPFCAAWPVGTHFLWHVFNAMLLAHLALALALTRLDAGPRVH